MVLKRISKVLVLLTMFIPIICLHVDAKEIYYVNENDVYLSKEEYDFIGEMYYDGYQRYLTLDEYDIVFSEIFDINNIVRESAVSSSNNFAVKNSSYSTSSKSITISKICSSNCLITVVAEWLTSPKIRSYDLIGAYFDDTSLVSTPVTRVVNSSGNSSSNEIVSDSNGFGTSIQLLADGTDMLITQTYTVKNSGMVYASYQHAIKNITVANSQKYTISYSGYGHVFLFNSSTIGSYYDAMSGVSIQM